MFVAWLFRVGHYTLITAVLGVVCTPPRTHVVIWDTRRAMYRARPGFDQVDTPTYRKGVRLHMHLLLCLHTRKFETWAIFLRWLLDEGYDVGHGRFGFTKKQIVPYHQPPYHLALGQSMPVQRLYKQLKAKRQQQKKRKDDLLTKATSSSSSSSSSSSYQACV